MLYRWFHPRSFPGPCLEPLGLFCAANLQPAAHPQQPVSPTPATNRLVGLISIGRAAHAGQPASSHARQPGPTLQLPEACLGTGAPKPLTSCVFDWPTWQIASAGLISRVFAALLPARNGGGGFIVWC